MQIGYCLHNGDVKYENKTKEDTRAEQREQREQCADCACATDPEANLLDPGGTTMTQLIDVLTLGLRAVQTGLLAGILYVLWWDVNHGIYPLVGGG